jgi:hypothetical protein
MKRTGFIATDNTNVGALTLAEVPQDPLQQ